MLYTLFMAASEISENALEEINKTDLEKFNARKNKTFELFNRV